MAAPTKRQTFDNIADGTTLSATAQTSTSGDQLSGLGGGGVKTVVSAGAVRGARGLYVQGTGVSSFITWTFTGVGAAGAEIYFPYNQSYTAPSGADHQVLQIRSASAGVVSVNWRALTKGFRVTDAAGGNAGDLNGGNELPNGLYRLFIACAKGTGAGDGRIVYRLDSASNGLIIDNFDDSTQNAGTADLAEVRAGKNGGTGNGEFWLDEFAYRSGDVQIMDMVLPPIAKQVITQRAALTRAAHF